MEKGKGVPLPFSFHEARYSSRRVKKEKRKKRRGWTIQPKPNKKK